MKKMKKFISLALVLVLALSLSVSAFAATITVDGEAGETYNAYKIFDVTKNTAGTGYSYTISTASAWYSVVESFPGLTLVATTNPAVFNVSVAADIFKPEDFAAELIKNTTGKTADATTSAATDGTAILTVAAAGYYLVDSSVGALCILNTAADDVNVIEKNVYPTLTKTADKATAAIGDTVRYTITVTDGKGTDKAIAAHDVMESGLTLNKDFAIKVGETAVAAENYEITYPTTGNTFEISFKDAYIAALDTDAKIVITYSAVLNENAEITGETNDNTAWLTYSGLKSVESKVSVSTFKFDLDKTDNDGAALNGAKFKLYDAPTAGNEIKLVKNADGTYRPAFAAETGVEIEAGSVTIKGLDSKAYYLEETAAPAGYNLLTERVAVDLTNGNVVRTDANGAVTYGIQVINLTGSELPSTGGIGTTIFYILGGLLAVGAVVVLVTRKRVHDTEA